MNVLSIDGVAIDAVYSCLPKRSEDNLARCAAVYGSEAKALSIVRATGIKSRRVVDRGVTSLDLCVGAARALLGDCKVAPDAVGAVICVTFTPARTMPCNACQAQRRLGLSRDLIAFDINLACSGWAYGLFTAGMYAKATGKKVLLLDGDVQTPYVDQADAATVPLMADAGTATLVAPDAKAASPWRFSFLTDGAKGDALTLPFGGAISMDGLGVFKFVTMDVLYFIRDFMAQVGVAPDELDAFVPHQANVFMIEQIAKRLKFPSEKLWLSGDVFGNSASATVPTTIAHCAPQGRDLRVLVSGFGGGLSASVGIVELSAGCRYRVFDRLENDQ